MSTQNDAYGDAVYEAWRRGMNPDRVDRDRVDYREAMGMDAHAAAAAEVRYLQRQDEARRAEYEAELDRQWEAEREQAAEESR